MQNQSTLTGRLDNVSQLTVNSDARWVMVGDGNVANLALNGGGVQFGNPGEFFKLTVGNLSGEGGTFFMHTNFGQVDTLTVTGTATGNHDVRIDASGFEPVAAASLPVIHIADGDAKFSLLGGQVDLGAYSYDLIQQGNNDWFLNTASRVINGLAADGDRARSLLGKLGATAGRDFNLGEGKVVQPYVRAAYVHGCVLCESNMVGGAIRCPCPGVSSQALWRAGVEGKN
ncbi:autotransporter outer membrane beta-barrel domain-containing protein [Pseudomonas mohnii]